LQEAETIAPPPEMDGEQFRRRSINLQPFRQRATTAKHMEAWTHERQKTGEVLLKHSKWLNQIKNELNSALAQSSSIDSPASSPPIAPSDLPVPNPAIALPTYATAPAGSSLRSQRREERLGRSVFRPPEETNVTDNTPVVWTLYRLISENSRIVANHRLQTNALQLSLQKNQDVTIHISTTPNKRKNNAFDDASFEAY
jgi:hypothetical protein